MTTQRTKNLWKMTGALVMLGLFLTVMLLGPMLREDPRPEDAVRLPTMTNVPPPGSLQFEVEAPKTKNAEPVE